MPIPTNSVRELRFSFDKNKMFSYPGIISKTTHPEVRRDSQGSEEILTRGERRAASLAVVLSLDTDTDKRVDS